MSTKIRIATLAAYEAVRAIPATDETVGYRSQALLALDGLLDNSAFSGCSRLEDIDGEAVSETRIVSGAA